ncbi:glycosyltransferase [Streptacidiphilus fuscans]|uniref:Glycosyltransferase n=1 Tax=Streptacidiphilus fuscans TaxID=2789292 RepID=A0A931AXG7_9ACTN|nr:glycosyltransferase [Streptacidiphilus fuscans]MBF9066536.1 glycosyltransferase [Streptacidiphilus fuscans]
MSVGVRRYAPCAPLPVALVLWLLSLRNVNLGGIGALGLLQVLPPLYWVAVVLLTGGFVATLRTPRLSQGWLAGYVLALIALIHATPTLLYPTLRYAWAWKHVAIVDAMLHHNGVVPNAGDLEIYNQWPGFFLLNVAVLKVLGLSSPVGYAAWVPPFANALMLVPLLLIYRSVTTDRRIVWTGVWIYYSVSWIGQDYFSPQAFAFLLYAWVMALVLRRLPAKARAPGEPASGRPPDRPTSGVLGGWGWSLVTVLLLVGAIVCSHQLTPLMVISGLALLMIPRRNRRVVWPPLVGAAVITAVYGATVARPYLSKNLGSFVSSLASPDGNVASGFRSLGSAAPEQVLVGFVDRGLSATVMLLAVACLVLRRWTRRTPIVWLLVAPLPLLAANAYGGEMLFRAYMFSLPAACFLIGALVHPSRRGQEAARTRWSGPRKALLPVLMLALLGGLFFSYDSKEAMNYYTSDEVAAASWMTDNAPPGAVIVAVTGAVPGLDERYDEHPEVVLAATAPQLQQLLVADPRTALLYSVGFVKSGTPVYLILSRAQMWELKLTGELPADTVARLADAVSATPGFTLVYRNANASVYRFTVG